MKNYLLFIVFAIIAFSCTSSERKYTVREYTFGGNDTAYIPESVTIYPDSDGYYRPFLVEIMFDKPNYHHYYFQCGSVYVTDLNDIPYVHIQNFKLAYPHTVSKKGWEFYDYILKNYVDTTCLPLLHAAFKGSTIIGVYLQGEKDKPYLFKKY